MPKKAAAAGKPLAEKKVQKIVEDKTFGLKNKNKSKKVQEYVAQVQQAARGGGKNGQSRSAEWYAAQEAKKKKEKEEKKALEKQMLKLLAEGYNGPLQGKAKKKHEEDQGTTNEPFWSNPKMDEKSHASPLLCVHVQPRKQSARNARLLSSMKRTLRFRSRRSNKFFTLRAKRQSSECVEN